MSTQAGVERELKFREVELDRLRDRLLELEAERIGPAALEDNWVFDRNGELEAERCILRLRRDPKGAKLAFKGPPRFEERTKVRAEHETAVDDPGAARSLLESLGYRVVRRYQKMRETWRLGGVTIALDHTPIGDFAEFEGEGAERVASRCELDPSYAERRSYLRLYADFQALNPGAPPDMVFGDRADRPPRAEGPQRASTSARSSAKNMERADR